MLRVPMSLMLLGVCAFPALAVASAAPRPSAVSDLHGKLCHTVDSSSYGSVRSCPGVRGYALLVYDDDDRTSIDIVAPRGAVYPLSLWDVVTPGYAVIGQKAEWQLGQRKGRQVPTALVLRLTKLDKHDTGELIAVARIDADGACVVFRGDARAPATERLAARAAANRSSKCLGAYQEE